MKSIFFGFVICILIVLPGNVKADDEREIKNHKVWEKEEKGASFSTNPVINAFMDAAFSKHIARRDKAYGVPPEGRFNSEIKDDYGHDHFLSIVKRQQPWIYPYVDRKNGIPKFNALNKWNKQILIATGLPNDLRPFNEPKPGNSSISARWLLSTYKTKHPEREEIVKEEVLTLVPTLESLTNLSISFLPTEEETKESNANVRIVVVDKDSNGYWETDFKRGNRVSGGTSYGERQFHKEYYSSPIRFRTLIEEHLYAAVPFTPDSHHQVDGFILPNKDNEIEMAICYIQNSHSDKVFRALVKECVLRSLGLPDSSDTGRNYFISHRKTHADWYDVGAAPAELTTFDMQILRILYSPSMKHGMTYDEAKEVLKRK